MTRMLEPYPMLDEVMLQRTGFTKGLPRFGYRKDGAMHSLDSEQIDGDSGYETFRLMGNEWHPRTHGLSMQISAEIMTPSFLFGAGGLAARQNSVLGVAVRWTNATSRLRGATSTRGAVSLDLLNSDNAHKPWSIDEEVTWGAGELRGLLQLELVLYLAQRGNRTRQEKHLAHLPGTILGVLSQYEVIIDGSGSLFPIQHEYRPKEQLWRVECGWADPFGEAFDDDAFCLRLNQAHPDYAAVIQADKAGMTPLLKEILASALQILIQRAMVDPRWQDIVQGNDIVPGTVAHMVHYFMTTFELDMYADIEEPQRLAEQLRRAVYTKL